jgi:hypothetical protein
MLIEPDFYKILQVAPDADPAVIDSAFKSLIKKYHPDTTVLPKEIAQEKSKEINQAHSVLKDPEKRKAYDLKRRIKGTDRSRLPVPAAEPAAVNFGEVETGKAFDVEIRITNQGGMPTSVQLGSQSLTLSVIGLPTSTDFQFPMYLKIRLTCSSDLKDGVHNNSVTLLLDEVPLDIPVTYEVLDSEAIEKNRLRYRRILTSDAVFRFGQRWKSDRWRLMLQKALADLDQYDIENAKKILAWFNDDCKQRRAP